MAENRVQMDLFGGESAGYAGHDGPAPRDGRIPPPLDVAPEPNMVRVAPGRHAWVPKDAATPPDEYVMCRWSKQPDGTYAPVPVAGRYVRLDSRTATLLGFPARAGKDGNKRCRYDTILRLGRAGGHKARGDVSADVAGNAGTDIHVRLDAELRQAF